MTRGVMPGIEYAWTEQFGYPGMEPGTMKPIAVMSHVMQGYQQTMIDWAHGLGDNPPKSAHFTINRAGRIVQHVNIYDAAWAAGDVYAPTWALWLPGMNPNWYVVHIEHEGFSIHPGYSYDYLYSRANPWPEAMKQASLRVHKWVFEEAAIRPGVNSVITHSMTNTVSRAQDPGDLWMTDVRPWLISSLQSPAPVPAPPPASELSPPLEKEDAGALFRGAYGYGTAYDGAEFEPLPQESGLRVYKVRLP